MIASIVILALALLAFGGWWIVQPHGRDALARGGQLPLFSARTPGSALRVVGAGPRGARRGAPTPPAPAAQWSEAPRPAVPDREVALRPVDETVAARPRVAPQRAVARHLDRPMDHLVERAAAPVVGADVGSAAPLVDRAPVKQNGRAAAAPDAASLGELKWAPPAQREPTNGTVQFLPGRLDVVQGRGVSGQEVRFVRPSRPGERAVVTFGRGEGPPYRHVQLNVPTVSRLHARLALDDATGRWSLENLSSTNPTVVNGEELHAGDAPRDLHDGDRLEMGEVLFTFHAQ